MRHLLIILMFALLPVRGWAMDVMTVAMAVQQLNATKNVANYSTGTGTSGMPDDCPMQLHTPDAGDNAPASLFHGCTACQLCMAMATGQATVTVQRHTTPPTQPERRTAGFTSATLAPSLKPPIG
jgi:hypothetical protein